MAITAVNMIYQGVGAGGWGSASTQPAPSALAGDVAGDTVQFYNLTSSQAGGNLLGFALPVGDAGNSTTYTVNWIDGTATLQYPPSGVIAFRNDPPAWTAKTFYPVNAIVLGSAHVQQVTIAGKSFTSAPTWKTDGTTVTESGGPTWKDLGAIEGVANSVVNVTAITNLGATVTISAHGTSTQVSVHWFYMIR